MGIVYERTVKPADKAGKFHLTPLHNFDFLHFWDDYIRGGAKNLKRDVRVRHSKREREPGPDPKHH